MNQLELWSEKVIDLITPYAEELKRDFYPLQSPVKENVDVLFIGLNPGGGYSYESQRKNTAWEFVDGKMTVERLLAGNPDFVNAIDKWSLFRGLKQIPYINNIIKTGSFVYTNYYYISTQSFNEVISDPAQIPVLEICKNLTLEFIRLIKPKTIIVLGTSNGIDKLPFENKRIILDGLKKRLLVKAEFEGINVYAIPHPSTLAISQLEIEALNTNLLELFENKELTPFKFERKVADKFSIEDFLGQANKRNIVLTEIIKEKSAEFRKNITVGNDYIEIKFVINGNDGYLGIRDSRAGNRGTNERFYKNLENTKLYYSKIPHPKLLKEGAWLIYKSMKSYEAETLEELYDFILNDFESIILLETDSL